MGMGVGVGVKVKNDVGMMNMTSDKRDDAKENRNDYDKWKAHTGKNAKSTRKFIKPLIS